MRESVIINGFQKLEGGIARLFHYMQTGLTGATLFEETLKNLLLQKGIFTETEFTEQMGKEIKRLQDAEAKRVEEEKKQLIVPSQAETNQINEEKKVQESKKVENVEESSTQKDTK